jgi:hypothetical protein
MAGLDRQGMNEEETPFRLPPQAPISSAGAKIPPRYFSASTGNQLPSGL